MKINEEHTTKLINSFTHLLSNAHSFFNAALIIHNETIKINQINITNCKIATDEKIPVKMFYPLENPRNHLFAIALELLAKHIINEAEKHNDPNKIPDLIQYSHSFDKINQKIITIASKFDYKFEEVDISNDLANKLTTILMWGSR